jgi:hypothetical protein
MNITFKFEEINIENETEKFVKNNYPHSGVYFVNKDYSNMYVVTSYSVYSVFLSGIEYNIAPEAETLIKKDLLLEIIAATHGRKL